PGHAVDLKMKALGHLSDLHGRACWRLTREVLRVDLVHRVPLIPIAEVAVHFDDIPEAVPCGFKDSLEVFGCLPGLCLDPAADWLVRLRVNGGLTRHVTEIARDNSRRVGAPRDPLSDDTARHQASFSGEYSSRRCEGLDEFARA